LFNPLGIPDASSSDLLAWTIQNRIGVALLILALVALSWVRAERREQLLRI
jgi:Flp pilus assembly protein protease CpaA